MFCRLFLYTHATDIETLVIVHLCNRELFSRVVYSSFGNINITRLHNTNVDLCIIHSIVMRIKSAVVLFPHTDDSTACLHRNRPYLFSMSLMPLHPYT